MSTSPVPAISGRLARKVRRDGVGASFRMLVHRAAKAAWLHEAHVWLVMSLAEPRPRPTMPQGLRLRHLEPAEVPLVEDLDVSVMLARERLARGHQLFAAFNDRRLVAVLWVFVGEAPTIVSPSGWLPLPARHVNPEDIVVAPDQRGRGIAPGMYSCVFDDLRDQGFSYVIGKIPVENTANRRACAKVGWHEFALVDLRRVLGRRHITVRSLGGSDVAWLKTAVEQARGPEQPTRTYRLRRRLRFVVDRLERR